MKKVNKIAVKMTPDAFLQYSYRVINSCVLPQQAHTAFAFLLNRVAFLKFKPIDDERVRDIVEFIFVEKMNKINIPFSSAWYSPTRK